MNRLIKIGLVSALSAFLTVGCSSGSAEPKEMNEASAHASAESISTSITRELPSKEVHKIIKAAGEKAGWKMTEFKRNAFVAEKFDGDDTESVTIVFYKDSFNVDPENDELVDAINEALNESEEE
jgi:outer membrane protein OmpA-like peptidoglycan-associated protein